jgi:hypothetical protein
MEEIMNRLVLTAALIVVVLLATLATYAKEPKETGYQTAMVLGVDPVAAESNYVGVSPTDAPLGPQTYAYDVRIRLNCNVYTARYESVTDYLPAAFAANHTVDVRLAAHVVYVSLPTQDREIKMGIVGRKRVKEQACPATT